MTGFRRALPPVLLAAAALACAAAVERSLACPMLLPPQPLRPLYKVSERVVVARVGAKEVLEAGDTMASVRIALHVTENLKGSPVRSLHLYRREFLSKGAARDGEQVRILSFSGRTAPRLKEGERYLFFLEPRAEGDGYKVHDEGYGIKELSDEGLKVYLERLKELAEITSRQPEDKHALVEWLVRCAEQPATRWEGAYELLLSAEVAARAEVLAEAKAAGTEEKAEGAEAPDAAGAPIVPEQAPAGPAAPPAPDAPSEIDIKRVPLTINNRYAVPDSALVPLLDPVQKQRLADAFFATTDPGEGDDELLRIVDDFDDPRLAPFLLARLHRVEEEAPAEAEFWLHSLAAALKNKEIIKLADSYSEEASYDEEDEEAEEEEEETEAETRTDDSAEEGDATVDEEDASEEVEEVPIDPEAEAAAVERATRKRSALLKSLLARIDLFVSTGQLAAN